MPITKNPKLLDVEFEYRNEQIVSSLMSKPEAEALLERLRETEWTKGDDTQERVWEPKAFIAKSKTGSDLFRVVMHTVTIITPLLNQYYPVINLNKHSLTPRWLDAHKIHFLALPPSQYLYSTVYMEHPDINGYIEQLKSPPFNLKINTSCHKNEDRVLLTPDNEFYRNLFDLHALCQAPLQLINELRIRYLDSARDKNANRQEKIKHYQLNHALAIIETELNQHLAHIHSHYPYASLANIENTLYELLIDLYCQHDMPIDAWNAFKKLTNPSAPHNQARLELIILSYYAQDADTQAPPNTFLINLAAMFCYQQKTSTLSNLLAHTLIKLIPGLDMNEQTISLMNVWQACSIQQLNDYLLSCYQELTLTIITYLFIKDEKKHPAPMYVKAITLLLKLSDSSAQMLLIQCLTHFFIANQAIEVPNTLGSNTPNYVNNWPDLLQALSSKQQNTTLKIVSRHSLFGSKKGATIDTREEVLAHYNHQLNLLEQEIKTPITTATEQELRP